MAYAGLAEAYVGLSGFHLPPREVMPKAKRAAETALSLDESLASAHAVLGFIHLVYDWDGPAAERALLRALELNPTLATARLHRAAHLTTQARHDEAVREIWRAVEFDPISIRTNSIATSLLLFTERYDEAIELARRGLEFEPNSAFALAFQAVAYVHQGRYAEAVANVKKAEQLDQSATILSLEAVVLAVAGLKDEAKRVIQRVEDIASNQYFCPYESRRGIRQPRRRRHCIPMVSPGDRGTSRLHGMARRRTLDRAVSLRPALRKPAARDRIGSTSAVAPSGVARASLLIGRCSPAPCSPHTRVRDSASKSMACTTVIEHRARPGCI